MELTGFRRRVVIEDALSPMIERAEIAIGTFQERADRHFARPAHTCAPGDCEICTAHQDAWSAILAEGHPTRQEIRVAFRGRGLGSVSWDEVRAVIIRAILRDSPELMDTDYEELPPMQQLARTIANWIMEAFDDACWMTEEQGLAFIAADRPHTLAG